MFKLGIFDQSCVCVFACQTLGTIVFEILIPRAFQKYILCLAFLTISIYVQIWVCVYLGPGKYGFCVNLGLCKSGFV